MTCLIIASRGALCRSSIVGIGNFSARSVECEHFYVVYVLLVVEEETGWEDTDVFGMRWSPEYLCSTVSYTKLIKHHNTNQFTLSNKMDPLPVYFTEIINSFSVVLTEKFTFF